MSYHRQTDQEEFYYVLEGPGRMKIEGDADDHAWLIVGAPPAPDDGRSAAE